MYLKKKLILNYSSSISSFPRRIKKDLKPEKVLRESELLFDPHSSPEEKKIQLAKLASLDKVEAYRIIERFLNEDPDELKNWAILALQENRMLLESRLLGENHVFISTGLGGKGDKLRYFIVLFGKETADLSDLQKKIIRTEFEIGLKKHKAEIEEIKFSGSMATMLALIPLKVIIKQIFSEAISECNQYGDFLISNFIITNVKTLSFKEIRDHFENQQKFHEEGDRWINDYDI